MPLLDATALRTAVTASTGCPHCEGLRCAGWESTPAPVGEPLLEPVGSLCDPAVAEPTLLERHAPTPEGRTDYWHPRAPLATAHFPYNLCSVWRCPQCRRGFVQYTEAGGYYVEHRIRAIDPALVE